MRWRTARKRSDEPFPPGLQPFAVNNGLDDPNHKLKRRKYQIPVERHANPHAGRRYEREQQLVPMLTTKNSFALRLSQKPNGSRIPSSSSVGSSEDANCLRYVSSGFPVLPYYPQSHR